MSYQTSSLEDVLPLTRRWNSSDNLEETEASAARTAFMKYAFTAVSVVALTTLLYINTENVVASNMPLQAKLAVDTVTTYATLGSDSQKFLFEGYQQSFGKKYEDKSEEATRFKHFQNFLASVDERNAKERVNGGSAIHGITKFADWSESEFENLLGYRKRRTGSKRLGEEYKVPSYVRSAAQSRDVSDWTNVYTTPVKDQGYCGSCWAFSATEQIETDSIRAGLLTIDDTLSPQQIVSCDKVDLGCFGGDTETAYEYVTSTGGIESDANYPYTSYWFVTTPACSVNSEDFEVTVVNWYYLAPGDDLEASMVDYVLATGPLSVCLDASSWSSYTSGVVTTCGYEVDHCVQAVGVDTTTMTWKIRNSWGTDWGDDGYIYLSAMNNTCDITYDPTFIKASPV